MYYYLLQCMCLFYRNPNIVDKNTNFHWFLMNFQIVAILHKINIIHNISLSFISIIHKLSIDG